MPITHLICFQCAIPVFEGLLNAEDNAIVLDLLFELATWHALAKLRLHTDSTLRSLKGSTTRLGQALRKFASTTCEKFETRDLPSEDAARGRRTAATKSKKRATAASEKSKSTGKKKQAAINLQRRRRRFNLSSYKPHALPDYAKTIRLLGTTDGYSTQTVCLNLFFSFSCLPTFPPFHWQGELEHRRCKRFYPRVHKGKFVVGIGKQIRRERILRNAGKDRGLNVTRPRKKQKKSSRPNPDIPHPESLPAAPPQQHYQIADDVRNWVDISRFLGEYHGDPAVHVSGSQLNFFRKINGIDEAIEFSSRPQGLRP